MTGATTESRRDLRERVAALEEAVAAAKSELGARRQQLERAESNADQARQRLSTAQRKERPSLGAVAKNAAFSRGALGLLLGLAAWVLYLAGGWAWGLVTGDDYRAEVTGSVLSTVNGGPPIADICRLTLREIGKKRCAAVLRCDSRNEPLLDATVSCGLATQRRECVDVDNNKATCIDGTPWVQGDGLTYDQAKHIVTLSRGEALIVVATHDRGHHQGLP